jgi:hypothetical protein
MTLQTEDSKLHRVGWVQAQGRTGSVHQKPMPTYEECLVYPAGDGQDCESIRCARSMGRIELP